MNYLENSPAHIIARLLVELGLATLATDNGLWPVYVTNEPSTPDNCITIFNTTGKDGGRSMIDGALLGHSGFQVRVRSHNHSTGWTKADAIQRDLAENVYDETVHVGDKNYLVHCVSNIGDVMDLGTDSSSKRVLFTINAITVINQL